MKRVLSTVLALICLFAFSAVAEPAADDFLSRIQGSFVELFPEMARDEYHQAWLDVVTPLVGEENAEATVEYLLNVCMGSKSFLNKGEISRGRGWSSRSRHRRSGDD